MIQLLIKDMFKELAKEGTEDKVSGILFFQKKWHEKVFFRLHRKFQSLRKW